MVIQKYGCSIIAGLNLISAEFAISTLQMSIACFANYMQNWTGFCQPKYYVWLLRKSLQKKLESHLAMQPYLV